MRLKTTKPEARSAEQKRSAAALESGPRGRVGGPFLPLLEHPAVFDKVQELGEVLRFNSKLPGPLRELAILVCARYWTAQYEWWAHAAVGKKEGLSEQIMAELKEGKRPSGMNEQEATVHDFCHALHRTKTVPDDLLAKAKAQFGDDGVIEMIALSGYYTLISMTLNTAAVEIPAGEVPMAKI
jgi:4-carboxymuconolactone decarboxylase